MQVYKAMRQGAETVAVKVMKGQQTDQAHAMFIKEINLLRQARHPHIVQYLGACRQVGHIHAQQDL